MPVVAETAPKPRASPWWVVVGLVLLLGFCVLRQVRVVLTPGGLYPVHSLRPGEVTVFAYVHPTNGGVGPGVRAFRSEEYGESGYFVMIQGERRGVSMGV